MLLITSLSTVHCLSLHLAEGVSRSSKYCTARACSRRMAFGCSRETDHPLRGRMSRSVAEVGYCFEQPRRTAIDT